MVYQACDNDNLPDGIYSVTKAHKMGNTLNLISKFTCSNLASHMFVHSFLARKRMKLVHVWMGEWDAVLGWRSFFLSTFLFVVFVSDLGQRKWYCNASEIIERSLLYIMRLFWWFGNCKICIIYNNKDIILFCYVNNM